MPKVSFRLSEKETIDVNVESGERLMDIARSSGIYIDAPCSGNGTCGKCRVQILSGETDSPVTRHITEEDYAAGWRLACETRVMGDVTVLVPETASAFRTGIRTADLNDRLRFPYGHPYRGPQRPHRARRFRRRTGRSESDRRDGRSGHFHL